MLDIILGFIYWLGIILLAILILALILILLVMFFPVSYRIIATKQADDVHVSAKAKWLFGALRVGYTYPQSGTIVAKLLWFTLFDSGRAPKEKTKDAEETTKAPKRKRQKGKDKKEAASKGKHNKKRHSKDKNTKGIINKVKTNQEENNQNETNKEKADKVKADKVKTDKVKTCCEKIQNKTLGEKDCVENATAASDAAPQDSSAQNGNTKDNSSRDGNSKDGNSKDGNSKDGNSKDVNSMDGNSKDGNSKDGNSKDVNSMDCSPEDDSTRDGTPQKQKKNLLYTIREICDKIKMIWENISYYWDLLQEDATRALFSQIFPVLSTVIKRIRPKKLRADILLGTGSPDTTGYLYGAFWMLRPMFYPDFMVKPDFERTVLEGRLEASGRITIIVFLISAFKIGTDKNLHLFLNKIKTAPGSSKVG